MNLQEQSLTGLGILLATIPKGASPETIAFFDEKRKEVQDEIDRREAAHRWKEANESIINLN